MIILNLSRLVHHPTCFHAVGDAAVLFMLALIFSAVGFYRVVYFISIGYAFSIVAMAVTVMILLFRDLTWASALHNVLLIIWGLRLGIYLLRRELQSSYGAAMADVHQRTAKMPFSRRALIWVGVSLLYVMMFSPSLFSLVPVPRRLAGLRLARRSSVCC